MKQVSSIAALLIWFAPLWSDAQDLLPPPQARFAFSMGFTMSVPKDDFARKMNRLPLGMDIGFLTRVKAGAPASAGLQLGWQGYGHRSMDVRLDGRDLTLSTTCNLLQAHGVVRIDAPHFWRLYPYVEGRAGINWLFTTTNTNGNGFYADDVWFGSQNSGTRLDKSRLTYSVGLAAGIRILPPRWDNIGILVSCAYLQSGFARFMVPADRGLAVTDPIQGYREKGAVVEMWQPTVGFSFNF